MKFDDTLMKCVIKDLNAHNHPMLLGEPGIGKSSWLENLARLKHTKCFTLACNQLADKADLTGARLVPMEGKPGMFKQVFFPHDTVMEAIAYAEEHPTEEPILFLDEINRTNADVTSALLSIPTSRKIGSIILPENICVVIAGNDKGNIVSLDEASVSRFVPYQTTPDVDTFIAVNPGLNRFIVETLKKHPDDIFCKFVYEDNGDSDDDDDRQNSYDISDLLEGDDGMRQFTTPRTISGASRFLNEFTDEELLELLSTETYVDGKAVNALQEVMEAHIGHTVFTAHLLVEIADGLQNKSNQAFAQITILKPDNFDTLKSLQTLRDVEDFVDGLTDKQKSALLAYMLYDKSDNTRLIPVFAKQMTGLDAQDSSALIHLVTQGKLCKTNLNALLQTDTPLAKMLLLLANVN